jgi:hypothetical protein
LEEKQPEVNVPNVAETVGPAPGRTEPVPGSRDEDIAGAIPSKPQRPQNFVNWGTVLFTVILFSIVSSVCSVYIYDKYFAIKLASFDLPAYLKSVQITVSKIDPGQEKEIAAKIQKSLSAVEKMITSQPRNVVIISGEVVLGDSKSVKKLEAPPF